MTPHPSPTERSFGLSVGTVCAAAGAFSWWRGHESLGPTLTMAGLVLVVAGLVMPAALRLPNRVWWQFAQLFGWINSRVLLTAFFMVVLTPVGCAMRLFGRNPLRGGQAATNWSAYPAGRSDPKHYEHLF